MIASRSARTAEYASLEHWSRAAYKLSSSSAALRNLAASRSSKITGALGSTMRRAMTRDSWARSLSLLMRLSSSSDRVGNSSQAIIAVVVVVIGTLGLDQL